MSPAPRRPTGLARRALPALVLTGASGAFLHALDHPASTSAAAATPTGGVTVVTVPTVPTVSTVPTTTMTTIPPAVTTVPAPVPAGDGTGTPTTVAIPAITAAPETTAAPVTTAPPATTCITYDGPVAMTKWGPVQVEAAVAADGTICSVDAIQTPNDRRKSVSINDRAVPVLNAAAIAAQGTNFDGVSGATITSNGYKSSLQAILDSVA